MQIGCGIELRGFSAEFSVVRKMPELRNKRHSADAFQDFILKCSHGRDVLRVDRHEKIMTIDKITAGCGNGSAVAVGILRLRDYQAICLK